MRYQYCSMKPGFDHGSDIITKKINEEERYKEFCFKKIKWVVSLHYKKCVMFILHAHTCIFLCLNFHVVIYTYTHMRILQLLFCMELPFV